MRTNWQCDNFYRCIDFLFSLGPHIGHTYTAVLADALARFNSMLGHTVFLSTGTDEHGTKVAKAAKLMKMQNPKYCSEISMQFREMCDMYQVEYSNFIRTTEERHEEAVRHFWVVKLINHQLYIGCALIDKHVKYKFCRTVWRKGGTSTKANILGGIMYRKKHLSQTQR